MFFGGIYGETKVLPKRLDYLEANTPTCRFRINIDVINECFGANRSLYMKASYPTNDKNNFKELHSDIRLFAWMPKIYLNSSGWNNSISADEEYIFEDAENSEAQDWISLDEHHKESYRLVFVTKALIIYCKYLQ